MKRFNIVSNGYDIDEVNRFIDIVIARMEKINAENIACKEEIEKLNQQIANGSNSERLEKAILAIQETGDVIKEAADREAALIIEDAKTNANAIIHEALVNAEKIENKKMILESNSKMYKEKIRSLLESELKLLDEMDKDELSEV